MTKLNENEENQQNGVLIVGYVSTGYVHSLGRLIVKFQQHSNRDWILKAALSNIHYTV